MSSKKRMSNFWRKFGLWKFQLVTFAGPKPIVCQGKEIESRKIQIEVSGGPSPEWASDQFREKKGTVKTPVRMNLEQL